mgnify:FL=1
MKNFLFYSFCICLLNIFSQEISVNPTKMNVVYIGVDNPITIMANGIDCEELTVKIKSGELVHVSDCDYIFKPGLKQGALFFYVFHKGNQIGKYEYRVKRIPDPVITLGGKLGPGHINKGTLAAQTGIIPILKNFDFQARFVVKEYTMIICAKDFYHLEHQPNGPVLTREMKDAINKIDGRAEVIFSDVVVIGPDKSTRKLPELRYYLTNYNEKKEECPTNQFSRRTSYYVSNDSVFSYFNCSCNKKIVKIESDRTEYKGLNNDYYFRTETLKTDTSEIYLEYYENGQVKFKTISILKNYSLFCEDESPIDLSKFHRTKYFEYYENGMVKVSGNYSLKEHNYTKTTEDIYLFTGCGTNLNCNYIEEVKHGDWLFFDIKGTLIKKETYNLGELLDN